MSFSRLAEFPQALTANAIAFDQLLWRAKATFSADVFRMGQEGTGPIRILEVVLDAFPIYLTTLGYFHPY